MTQVSIPSRDDRLIAAIGAIYDAAPEPSLWPRALQSIADVLGDVGANLFWRRSDGGVGNIVSPGLRDALETYEREEWWRHDIRASRAYEYGFRRNEGVLTDRHIATAAEIETHPIYTQFLARFHLRWTAGIEISPDPAMAVNIGVQRSRDKRPFDDAELEILKKIGPHAEKSLRLSMRLFDAELSKIGLGEALVKVGIGVFVLDSLSRVLFSNPMAEKLLCDGLAISNKRLIFARPSDCEALNVAIEQAVHGTSTVAPKAFVVQREHNARPLVIYVIPITAASRPLAQFLTHASVIVLAIDSQAGDVPDPALVRDVLGITLGEARVAALIGSGLPPRDAAEKLGITEETARTTLKRVFGKVGVSRQSELAALLTKLVLR